MRRILAPAFAAAALLIASSQAEAQRGGGGGHSMSGGHSMRGGHSMGGGRSMGGHVSSGHGSHGSVSRGGSWHGGSHGWNGGSHGHVSTWHGGSGWHGGWHGGHGWHWGRGWGWGWSGVGWGWGWGWGYPYNGYYGVYGYPAYAGYGYGNGGYGGYGTGDWTSVKTDVSPEEARVFLDGRYIGTADDFDGYPDFLYLQSGKYHLEFQLEGFETQSIEIDAHPGAHVKVDNHLRKIPGAKQYGSYDTPEPQGGVQRFFGKSRDQKNDIVIQPDQGNGYDNGNPQNMDWRDRDNGQGNQEGPPQAPPPGKSYDDPPPPDKDRESVRQPAAPAPVPGGKARLVFKVEPGDAAVYVDDRFAGTGEELASLSRGLQVAPGMHRIVVSRPGFASESTQVDAVPGRSETVEITLERP